MFSNVYKWLLAYLSVKHNVSPQQAFLVCSYWCPFGEVKSMALPVFSLSKIVAIWKLWTWISGFIFSDHNYYYSGAPLMRTHLGPFQSVMNRKVSSFKFFFICLRYIWDHKQYPRYSGCSYFRGVHKAVFHCLLYCTHNLTLSLLCTCCWTGGSHGCMVQQHLCLLPI